MELFVVVWNSLMANLDSVTISLLPVLLKDLLRTVMSIPKKKKSYDITKISFVMRSVYGFI